MESKDLKMNEKGPGGPEPEESPAFDFKNKRPSYLDAGVHSVQTVRNFDLNIVRSLESAFIQEDTAADSEPIKTYLRIRPYKSRRGESETISIIDNRTIIANSVAPGMKGVAKKTEYKFTKVIDGNCSQQVVFEHAIAPLMEHLERAENCLVFSYGATNSGKTYTMQGRNDKYGIIPRTLDHMFSRFEDRLYKGGDIQPFMYESTRALNEEEQKVIRLKKRILLEAAAKTVEMKNRCSTASSMASSHCGSFRYVAGVPINNTEFPSYYGAQSNMVCLWVSFVELYNEKCYDLLDHVENGKGKRKDLKVVADKGGHAYIRDVTELPVFNEEEAYAIYVAGYKKLQMGTTKLNKASSRSHCFFTIRVVELGATKGTVFPMRTYRMTFCDLAGVERVSQTENTGGQLQESSNINKSLLSLLKVIRMIRERQCKSNTRQSFLEKIPFRDSKLTRIFQGFFTSSTHIAMIVNINPNPNMLESTIQTLQNSAIASNIIAYRPSEAPKIVVASIINNSSFLHSSRDLEDVMEESEEEYCCEYEAPTNKNEFPENKPVNTLWRETPRYHSSPKTDAKPNLVLDEVNHHSNSDKENELEDGSTVIPKKMYFANILKLQEQLYEARNEIKRLKSENRTIEQETREKMSELYRQGLDSNNTFRKEILAGQTEALKKSEKRCTELKSRLELRKTNLVSTSTQTD